MGKRSRRDKELMRLSEEVMDSIGKVRQRANSLMDIVHPGNQSPDRAPVNACEGLMLVMWQGHYLAEADRILATMQLLLSRAKVH